MDDEKQLSTFDIYFTFLEKIGGIYDRLLGRFDSKGAALTSFSESEKVFCAVCARIYKTACALKILCKEGKTEDSEPILRVLQEDIISILWVMQTDSANRLNDIKAREKFFAYNQLERYKEHLQGLQKKKFTKRRDREIKRVQKIVTKFQPQITNLLIKYKKYNLKSSRDVQWSGFPITPTLRQMAEIVGLKLDHLISYWISSTYVHFSLQKLTHYLKHSDKGLEFVITPNYKLIPDILIPLVHLMIIFAQSFNKYFGLRFNNEIKTFRREFYTSLKQKRK
ncbi:MAG: hypothetical protein A2V73_03415 [candidate division Zixibacteria bacterium RBG_19FT_COMBO_42_43]|nr:MAG: hypothetical protein A2V73_03415 [candidate division Zixibacteria bacterium RBG_19FT_COMBO_42_43]